MTDRIVVETMTATTPREISFVFEDIAIEYAVLGRGESSRLYRFCKKMYRPSCLTH